MVGRQVNFFFTPKDEDKFLEEIKSRGDIVVTDKNETLTDVNAFYLNLNSQDQVLIRSTQSKICLSGKFIESDESEIIVYTRSTSLSFFKQDPLPHVTFEEYVSSLNANRYFSRKGEVVRATDMTKEDLYKQYQQWITARDNKDKNLLESGRIWAAMSYVKDNAWVNKEKWFKDWYHLYAKWIKKQCRLSKDKMEYIGEDAYKAYKERRLIIEGSEWE